MDTITIKNFRCFREKQEVRLAPLTLLVGENSTGKTSFLALLSVLNSLARGNSPDFKRPPYDLGSFDEITHYRGGGREKIFNVEFSFSSPGVGSQDKWKFAVQFSKDKEGTAPVPIYQRVSLNRTDEEDNGHGWIEIDFRSSSVKLALGTRQITCYRTPSRILQPSRDSFFNILAQISHSSEINSGLIDVPKSKEDGFKLTKEDFRFLLDKIFFVMSRLPPVFASAPVRSEPRRTYNPARPTFDPEGNYIPMILAQLSSHKPKTWETLKKHLEKFGQSSDLFNEIKIRRLGTSSSNPFQVQVRKSGQKRKGVWRNLMDVGYGISQVLPIVTELLIDQQRSNKNSSPQQFLLQQPEVHLHPSAQAALGSFFCQMACPKRQLIVETHSDNLVDRIRMDVRDGISGLRPEHVSILFFERRELLDVQIHSLNLDQEGNVLGAPESYRQFFMDEMTRSLWPEHSMVEA